MRRLKLNLCLGLGLLTAAVPAGAQSTTVLTPAPPSREDTVGPEQLRNFSLGGGNAPAANSDTAGSATTAAPSRGSSRPAPSPATAASTAPRERVAAPVADAQPQRASPVPVEPARTGATAAARSVTVPLQSPAPAAATPDLPTDPSPPVALPSPAATPPADLGDGSSGSSMLVWLLLLIAAAGAGGAWWLLRHRGGPGSRPALAGGGFDLGTPVEPREAIPAARRTPAPAPTAPPLARAPAAGLVQRPSPAPTPAAPPRPAAPSGGGIVSSRLRPWVELDLRADRAVVDEQGVTLFFDLTVINSGNAPARDVRIEAIMLNAGSDQDNNLDTFYQRPPPEGGSIEVIAPLAQMSLQSHVRLQREAVREYEVEGRKLFVPIVALQASYKWSAGEGRTSINYLVGRTGEGDAEKMAPIRMDLGPRIFRGLGQRLNQSGIRR